MDTGNILSVEQFMSYKSVNTSLPPSLKEFTNIMNNKNHRRTTWKKKSNVTFDSKIMNILNKISDDNFEDIVAETAFITINTSEQLNILVNCIFQKAVSDQNFTNVYAKLCKELSNLTASEDENFTDSMISKCTEFINSYAQNKSSDKYSLTGYVNFVSCLYCVEFISSQYIVTCVDTVSSFEDRRTMYTVDGVCHILKIVSSTMISKDRDSFIYCLNKINEIKEEGVSMKDKFTIMDTLDIVNPLLAK